MRSGTAAPTPEELFAWYRSDRPNRVLLRIARRAAAGLRESIASADEPDRGTFRRRVWGPAVLRIGDRDLDEPFQQAVVDDGALDALEAASSDPDLVAEGGEIFGWDGPNFAPGTSEESQAGFVGRAVACLNNPSLQPIEKVQGLLALPGFTPAVATGLAMVCFPHEFVGRTGATAAGLRTLGYPASTLDEYERSACELSQRLGAEDMIELYAFLSAVGGDAEEVPFDRASPEAARRVLERLFPLERTRRFALAVLATSIRAAHEVNPASWAVTLNRNYVRLNVGQVEQVVLSADRMRVLVDEASLGTLAAERFAGVWENARYKKLPGALAAAVHPAALEGDWRLLAEAHLVAVREAARNRTGYYRSHSSGVLEYVRSLLGVDLPDPTHPGPVPPPVDETPRQAFDRIRDEIARAGLRLPERLLRRYRTALETRGFVILSGVSGTGKTWLAEAYADAVGAERLVVPVAPNWTTNEDLLGYQSPLDGGYRHTEFSEFLVAAGTAFECDGDRARPYHLVLDEMNLARVEYYFAKFLSAMEARARYGSARVSLAPNLSATLGTNLYFVGTVNVDETTHPFADKVYDRAQLIELEACAEDLRAALAGEPYADLVMKVWEVVSPVAPFAFRVITELRAYVREAERLGASWEDAVDEQLLQKVLPKFRGADLRVERALAGFLDCLPGGAYPLSRARAERMREGFASHGFASYF